MNLLRNNKQNNNTMDTIKIKVSNLLESIRKNRDGHKEIFLKAFEGYRLECIKVLEQNLSTLKEGKLQAVRFGEMPPQDRTSDYDRIIRMLEMTVDDVVELSQSEFTQYVMDDWSWKQNWTASNFKYTSHE